MLGIVVCLSSSNLSSSTPQTPSPPTHPQPSRARSSTPSFNISSPYPLSPPPLLLLPPPPRFLLLHQLLLLHYSLDSAPVCLLFPSTSFPPLSVFLRLSPLFLSPVSSCLPSSSSLSLPFPFPLPSSTHPSPHSYSQCHFLRASSQPAAFTHRARHTTSPLPHPFTPTPPLPEVVEGGVRIFPLV